MRSHRKPGPARGRESLLTGLPQRGIFARSGRSHAATPCGGGGHLMIRLIKRYGSRKLYDTEESRYVSLEELAAWIRSGQQIRVIDNKSSDDQSLRPRNA